MSEKTGSSFQSARDEAIRTLVLRGDLTPEQVSALKLGEVHLATNRLIIEPDEFDLPSVARVGRVSLNLDRDMQRALIAWLVARPDGPNDHLFPGEGLAGLDVATINELLAGAKPAEAPPDAHAVDVTTPPRAESEVATEAAGEPSPASPRRLAEEVPRPAPPVMERQAEPQPVSLDEIESLRRRLAESYDAWAPAMPSPPAAKRQQEVEAPPPASVEVEPLEGVSELELPWGPIAPTEEGELEPTALPREEVPGAETAPTPSAGVSDLLTRLWGWGETKFTLNLSFRAVMLVGLALFVVCCVGLVLAGQSMLRGGGLAGMLAGATPSESPVPTEEAVPSATFTPSPTATPTATATATPELSPSPAVGEAPAPTDTPPLPPTPGPTSTPIILVVTATPTPEPPATATLVPADTPATSAPAEPTPTSTPAFKYPAPELLAPEDGSTVPGVIAILKWESVGPLADDEWYAVRFVFLEQGQLVYNGDRVKVPEWRVPDRFYYQADGPALEYRWFVFVERDNPDGSVTQLGPESETFAFRWE
jgi:hypothetical protein